MNRFSVLGPAMESQMVDRMMMQQIYQIIEDETGLPPCDEIKVNIVENHATLTFKVVVFFPGNYAVTHDISVKELSQLRISDQFDLFYRSIRVAAQKWQKAIQ